MSSHRIQVEDEPGEQFVYNELAEATHATAISLAHLVFLPLPLPPQGSTSVDRQSGLRREEHKIVLKQLSITLELLEPKPRRRNTLQTDTETQITRTLTHSLGLLEPWLPRMVADIRAGTLGQGEASRQPSRAPRKTRASTSGEFCREMWSWLDDLYSHPATRVVLREGEEFTDIQRCDILTCAANLEMPQYPALEVIAHSGWRDYPEQQWPEPMIWAKTRVLDADQLLEMPNQEDRPSQAGAPIRGFSSLSEELTDDEASPKEEEPSWESEPLAPGGWIFAKVPLIWMGADKRGARGDELRTELSKRAFDLACALPQSPTLVVLLLEGVEQEKEGESSSQGVSVRQGESPKQGESFGGEGSVGRGAPSKQDQPCLGVDQPDPVVEAGPVPSALLIQVTLEAQKHCFDVCVNNFPRLVQLVCQREDDEE